MSRNRPQPAVDPLVGTTIEGLEVLRPGAEGVAVARHPDGRVVLVRHALPGEVVDVVVTGAGKGGRFLRADAVSVHSASPDRVSVPCAYAVPGGCGGCDLLFASSDAQRAWKSEVLADQLRRIAGLDVPIQVEPVGDGAATGWRTRVRFAVTAEGRLALRGSRSHDLTVIDTCAQTVPAIAELDLTNVLLPGADEVVIAAGEGGVVATARPSSFNAALADGLPQQVSVPGVRGSGVVQQRAGDRTWTLAPDAFWQVHPGATGVLVDAVRTALQPRAGEHLVDLYAGAGLFAAGLIDVLGPGGRIDAVESNGAAVLAGAAALSDVSNLQWHVAEVAAWMRGKDSVRRADLVVLDPPRTGAGVEVIDLIAKRSPRAVAYVACDGATFARDLAHALDLGWTLESLRAFDLFPSTAHVEIVAGLRPGSGTQN